jgi:hypothetical protein
MTPSLASRTSEFSDNPPPDREADVMRASIAVLRDRLPATWTVEEGAAPDRASDAGFDAELRLRAPDHAEAVVLIHAKRLLNTRDVSMALEALRRAAARRGDDEEVVVLLASRYLAPATRERIAAAGAGYIDITGNVCITVGRPALFLRDRGTDRDPWRGPGRPRDTLRGPAAARVVRALIDFAPPYTVPEISERSGASTGAAYRVVDLLEGQGLLKRERYGPISAVEWRPLIERWSQDYGFAESNTVQTFLDPRGLDALTDRLASQPNLTYVVTGSLAAQRMAPYAPARLAMLYVRDLAAASDALGLRPTESGANVALAAGDYDVVFDRTDVVDGIRMAAPSQVAADLLTGPGRNPSEATALLDWMADHEAHWRH